MNIKKTSFGHIVWLIHKEMEDVAVNEEIENLKKIGKVAVLVSGEEKISGVISRLIKNNISN